jgi:hypothetical protein
LLSCCHFSGVSSSSGQPRISPNAAASSADGGSTGVAGGVTFPPGDFLQNIIQMAANAALQGQTGRQGFTHWLVS